MNLRRKGNQKQCFRVVSETETISISEAVRSDEFNSLVQNPSPYSNINYLPDSVLYLPAVLNECKPGSTVGVRTSDLSEVRDYSDKLRHLGLHHKIVVNRNTEHTIFHFTKELDLLDSIDYMSEDKAYGRFLGVPEADNQWYEEEESPSISEATPILDHISIDDLENIEFARLTSWICRPTLGGLRRTINIGMDFYDLACTLDRDYGFNNPLDWCDNEMVRLAGYWY
jgi:hypothetical protein